MIPIVSLVAIAPSARARLGTGKSPRRITSLLAVALLLLLVQLGTGASAAPRTIAENCDPSSFVFGPERYHLVVSACGPRYVVRNKNYTYVVVVKNYGNARGDPTSRS
jgi:hypothetical protein